MRLLLDSSGTGGVVGAHLVHLVDGAVGASPHHHSRSAELFFVVHGSADLLAGDKIITATEGDLILVPPGVAHAFAASPGHDAYLLVVMTPGIERFEFFRELAHVMDGEADMAEFLQRQATFDTYPSDDTRWSARHD